MSMSRVCTSLAALLLSAPAYAGWAGPKYHDILVHPDHTDRSIGTRVPHHGIWAESDEGGAVVRIFGEDFSSWQQGLITTAIQSSAGMDLKMKHHWLVNANKDATGELDSEYTMAVCEGDPDTDVDLTGGCDCGAGTLVWSTGDTSSLTHYEPNNIPYMRGSRDNGWEWMSHNFQDSSYTWDDNAWVCFEWEAEGTATANSSYAFSFVQISESYGTYLIDW